MKTKLWITRIDWWVSSQYIIYTYVGKISIIKIIKTLQITLSFQPSAVSYCWAPDDPLSTCCTLFLFYEFIFLLELCFITKTVLMLYFYFFQNRMRPLGGGGGGLGGGGGGGGRGGGGGLLLTNYIVLSAVLSQQLRKNIF